MDTRRGPALGAFPSLIVPGLGHPYRGRWRAACGVALLFSVAAALAAAACGRPQPLALTGAERALARRVGFTDSALTAVREVARGPVSELRPLDSLGNLLPARGIAIALPQHQAERAVGRLRARLGAGYLAFLAQRAFGHGSDTVGVIRTADQLDALRVRGTSGPNYDISSDSVIALVRRWDAEFGLDVIGAAPDWFEARFRRPPADFRAFAALVYRVCPDVVDQGTNTVEALADEMRRTGTLYCWWD